MLGQSPWVDGRRATAASPRGGQAEAQDEGPQRLPEHEERSAKAATDVDHPGRASQRPHDLSSLAIAAEASAILSSASSPPIAAASATQWERWSSRSSSETDWRAL